jgi:hypothetical protein
MPSPCFVAFPRHQDNCPGVVDVRVSVNSNEYQTEQSALAFRQFQPGSIGQKAKVFVAPTRYVQPYGSLCFCFTSILAACVRQMLVSCSDRLYSPHFVCKSVLSLTPRAESRQIRRRLCDYEIGSSQLTDGKCEKDVCPLLLPSGLDDNFLHFSPGRCDGVPA